MGPLWRRILFATRISTKRPGAPPPLPPRSRSGSSERSAPGGGYQQQTGPPQFAPLPAGISKKIEEMAAAAAKKQKQPQQQQQQKLTPEETEFLADLAKQFGITELKLEDLKNPQSALMKLIRGERRQIQEELANRVLSDISEESGGGDSNSSATQNSERSSGTTTPRPQKQVPRRTTTPIDAMDADGEGSTTTTAEHEGPSSSTIVPKKEALSPNASQDSTVQNPSPFRHLPDTEFDLLMDAVDRVKRDQDKRKSEQSPSLLKQEENDLESYRPYSAYAEYEREVKSLQNT
uniref:Uncharacterized protein n=1 Tax=Meloidogyne enterolobii TaxID=390850 RepID=A0A6V7YCM0_MELEN|nr:unnamed protein product [Meloidogyne enterolobii]